MPADLNRVTLVGRLTRNPDIRHTAGGSSVASIRLACTSRTKDQSGEWVDQPNYFDVVVFGRQAETVGDYLEKGRRIGVDGRLSWREREASDGGKRQSVEVVANDVFFLDSRQSDTPVGRAATDLPSPAAPAVVSNDDIPF